jgi:hypothetical protein
MMKNFYFALVSGNLPSEMKGKKWAGNVVNVNKVGLGVVTRFVSG